MLTADEISEWVGTVIDVTERKLAEKGLHEAQAELANATRLATLGELATSVAHEINQPLGAIVNNSNVCVRLFDKDGSKDEIREALSDIVMDAPWGQLSHSAYSGAREENAPQNGAIGVERNL